MGERSSKLKPIQTLIKIAVVLIGLSLLAAIAIPNFVHVRTCPPFNSCVANLRMLDAAKQQWALEYNQTNLNHVVTCHDVAPFLGRGATGSLDFIYCPDDKTKRCSNSYTLGDLKTPPKCKINPAMHFIN